MAHVAVLLAVLAGAWILLAPGPIGAPWLACGAASLGAACLGAWRLGLLGRESAFLARAPHLIFLVLSRTPAVASATLLFIRAVARPRAALHPALVRLRMRPSPDAAAAVLSGAVGLAPGLIAVEATPDSLLLHALVEDDADEGELRDLEAAARRAVGAP